MPCFAAPVLYAALPSSFDVFEIAVDMGLMWLRRPGTAGNLVIDLHIHQVDGVLQTSWPGPNQCDLISRPARHVSVSVVLHPK